MPENFAGGLTQDTRKKMSDLLNKNVANTIALTLAVKQAHWNLKGPGFIGVHELLDEVAGRLRDSTDLMAERAVILGAAAKGSVEDVANGAEIKTYPDNLVRIEDHIDALKERFLTVGETLRKSIDTAGDAGDEDTADVLTEVSRSVDKDAWFIGANAVAA